MNLSQVWLNDSGLKYCRFILTITSHNVDLNFNPDQLFQCLWKNLKMMKGETTVVKKTKKKLLLLLLWMIKLTVLSPFRAEMSRKETAAKSRTRLWRSTLGTTMLAGSSAFQSIRAGRSLKSVGRSSSSMLRSSSDSLMGPHDIFRKPFCKGKVVFIHVLTSPWFRSNTEQILSYSRAFN